MNDKMQSLKGNQSLSLIDLLPNSYTVSNFGVTCEDKAKRRNSGAKTKTFEKNCHLLSYPAKKIRRICARWCMTQSSTKELLSPFENPERVLRSRRKLLETPSLAESSLVKIFKSKSTLKKNKPTIDADIQFELKGQFLKELRDNTFSGPEHEDANEHIENVLEIVDLFHVPKITQDQLMLRAFPVSLIGAEPDESLFREWERFKEVLMKCPQHYLTDMQEVILFYNGLDVPTRQILYSRGVIPTKTAADAKVVIQEMAEYSQKWHNRTSSRSRSTKTSDGLAAIQAQLNNLVR
ncbi:hypothetical protein Tco_0621102 [Tanacetum coccineum]